jgi:hypothetical protein
MVNTYNITPHNAFNYLVQDINGKYRKFSPEMVNKNRDLEELYIR